MKNILKYGQEILLKSKWLGNRYVIILLCFILWILFFDNYSIINHSILNKDLKTLQESKTYFQQELIKDSIETIQMKNPEYIEKYAREKYFMKRENEDVYIIEFDEKLLKEKLK